MTLAAVDLPRTQLTTTGLLLPADLSFEEWSELGGRLFEAERAVMWWIGDWWRFGERKYGEQASQAVEIGYAAGTVSNAAAVASRIEMPRRRGDLSFSHHQTVAYLPADDQDYWLTEAERGEWTRNEMRDRVKRGRQPDGAEEIAIEYSTAVWVDLGVLMESLESLLSKDAPAIAAAVPQRRRATTAKRLRKLGTGLGRIAWSLEGTEDSDGRNT